jgi:transketolase
MNEDARAGHSPDLEQVRELARQLRIDSIRMSTRAGSGHPTSSMSAADIGATLLARHLHYDWQSPTDPENDYLIFSKGHASPLLYAMFKAAGVVSDETLMNEYRQPGSPWQGHPTPALPWVPVATGSLGQGLPDAVGIAMAGQYLEKSDRHVWVLCGDSELAEGSVWEALDTAGARKLAKLVVVVDVNRLGMRGPTRLQWDLAALRARMEAFGCQPIVVDGHDVRSLDEAMTAAARSHLTTVILAHTVKGRGVPELEDQEGWHGKPLPEEMAARAIDHLQQTSLAITGVQQRPQKDGAPSRSVPTFGRVESRRRQGSEPVELPQYEVGRAVATRTAYGETLAALGADPRVVVVDAEVGNSTHADRFHKRYPDRYFDVYTAEQQMIATCIGLSVRGYVPFAATFGAFLTRAHDFLRMAAISRADIRVAGSHAGVEVGPDGSSQMALEDLAMMRAIHGSTVLYPSDAASAVKLVERMMHCPGVVYMRTTRGAYPVLYQESEEFPVGGSKTLMSSGADDVVTIVAAGVTVHTCHEAARRLRERGLPVRLIDLYSIKPIDQAALVQAVSATGGRLVVVEDHHPEGGMGEAVLSVLVGVTHPLVLEHLAVRNVPTSGEPAQLLAEARIDAAHVCAAVERILAWPPANANGPKR